MSARNKLARAAMICILLLLTVASAFALTNIQEEKLAQLIELSRGNESRMQRVVELIEEKNIDVGSSERVSGLLNEAAQEVELDVTHIVPLTAKAPEQQTASPPPSIESPTDPVEDAASDSSSFAFLSFGLVVVVFAGVIFLVVSPAQPTIPSDYDARKFVHDNLFAGRSKDEIFQSLVYSGWQKESVELLLQELENPDKLKEIEQIELGKHILEQEQQGLHMDAIIAGLKSKGWSDQDIKKAQKMHKIWKKK